LLIVGLVPNDPPQRTLIDQYIAAIDIRMLVNFGAFERSEPEYRSLLEAAGFEFVSRRSSTNAFSVIEAVRP